MTEPSQYFKGRTVQEQMNEVIGYVDVRSAEVATNAIAADVAQVHQDMLDADADATAAAASAAAAAGTLANAVKKTGEASQSIAGDIAVAGDLTGGTVTVPAPVNNTDAASKKYVDDQDALKISITDINSYAVGLTGNQNPIAGTKKFVGKIEGIVNDTTPRIPFDATRKWYKVAKIPANRSIKFSVNMLHESGASFGVWNFVAVLASTNTMVKLSYKVGVGYINNYDITTSVCVGYDGTDFYLYLYAASYVYNNVNFDYIASFGNIVNASDIEISVVEEDPTSTGYTLTYATV